MLMKSGPAWGVGGLILVVLLSVVSWAPALAQVELPVWAENLTCDPAVQHYRGVAYCTGVIPSNDDQSYTAHVIVVDLESPGIQIQYVLPQGIDGRGQTGECRDVNRSTKYLDPPRGPGCNDPNNQDWYPVMSLEQAVQGLSDPGLAVVINGDYSACTIPGCQGYRDHGPEGLTVVRGDRLDGPMMGDRDNNIINRPWLAISQEAPLRGEIHQFRSDDGSLPYDWVFTGVGGAPWLIQNGEVSEAAILSCDGARGSCRDGASQTSVGLTQDRRWLFFVLGVGAGKLTDLARFMDEQLDAWQAIKLDGGGSSQLYYGGASDPFVERGDGRLLTNFLAIMAQPGSGIVLPQEPSPPTGPEPRWWDQLWQDLSDWLQGLADDVRQRLDEWWQEQQRELEERIDQWWEETQRRFTDWLEDQFLQWLSDVCGTALLPVGTVAGIWYLNRCQSVTLILPKIRHISS
jgi:hypothetical protein